jgi:protein-S-isoprenylcysteine O-methyltransferase Ste14
MTAMLFVLAQFGLFALFAFAALFIPAANTPLSFQVGSVIALIGVGIVGIAILEHMQRNAAPPSIVPTPNERAKLVTTGLYRFARHPIYSGVLLAALGTCIAHGGILVIAVGVLFVPFFTFKSMYEESLLRAVYPDYAAYMKRTGRFFPGL